MDLCALQFEAIIVLPSVVCLSYFREPWFHLVTWPTAPYGSCCKITFTIMMMIMIIIINIVGLIGRYEYV